MLSSWQLYEKRFCKETCDRIVTLAKLLPESDARVGNNKVDNNVGSIAPEVRISKIRWLNGAMPDFKELFLDINDMFYEVNCSFGLDINYLRSLQFTEYQATSLGKYDWHIDTLFECASLSQRKISMVIQLSDPEDYEGGNLEIKPLFYESPNLNTLRQQGTAIFFPSIVEHRVTPVTKGTRYSLVAWMEGPRWR